MHELITAIATLLWPLIMLAALLMFRHAINRVLRTAERRELEVEVGGQRLTFHELNDQQNDMIQDLQRQLSVLSRKLEEQEAAASRPVSVPADGTEPVNGDREHPGSSVRISPSGQPASGSSSQDGASLPPGEPGGEQLDLPPVQAPTGSEPFAVLWVGERPENHALLVGQLRDNGVRVTVSSTTAEAVAELSERPYRLIVSDMSRKEGDRRQPDAGLSLLRELRDLGVDTPVIVFGGQRGQAQYGDQARLLGAVTTTSSAYEMFRHFQNFGLL